MSDVQFIPYVGPNEVQAVAGNAVDVSIGMALASMPSAARGVLQQLEPAVIAAEANGAGAPAVIGVARYATLNAGDNQIYQKWGPLTLTTAEWTAITEEASHLTPGDTYYLSAANPGKLTNVAPVAAGTYQTVVGIALTENTLDVQPGVPVGPHA